MMTDQPKPPHAHLWRELGDCPGSWQYLRAVIDGPTGARVDVYRCTGCGELYRPPTPRN